MTQIALEKGPTTGTSRARVGQRFGRRWLTDSRSNSHEEQLKTKGSYRKLYVDLKFLKAQLGFGWNAATGMVTAENGTWKETHRDGGDKCALVLTNSSDLSKNSVKRRQDLTKAIELDLSDDDEIAFKQSAPERSIVQKAERLIVRKAGRLIVQKAERLIVQSFHKLNERSFKQAERMIVRSFGPRKNE
ncbi:hypothetical protein PSHT_04754 [Puccinia striiformis]|uniref:Myb/SANT-like domain-containing protein n=1 Tax=Puccinia striiformis TaxID=27350 RepID=A0A2S4WC20_9BASI|nr:hypothetical protein PSHT_04754 [Puccinia striiformis]